MTQQAIDIDILYPVRIRKNQGKGESFSFMSFFYYYYGEMGERSCCASSAVSAAFVSCNTLREKPLVLTTRKPKKGRVL
jgi:hypothetical protein